MTFQFQSPVFLVGDGELSEHQFRSLYSDPHPLIAADGGANALRDFLMIPHAVIGDMDSIRDRDFFEKQSQLVHIEDQDTTDLEKCLMEVEAPLYLALGFIGKRFDHTLEILHVLEKYSHKQIVFFSKEDVIIRLPKSFEIELPLGTRFSLYPLKRTLLLSSVGLKYPLKGLIMEQGQMIGTSNETTESTVRIEQSEEGLIAIVPIEHVAALLSSTLNLRSYGSLDA
jgi:thiamine pyrophosphokinase